VGGINNQMNAGSNKNTPKAWQGQMPLDIKCSFGRNITAFIIHGG